MKLKDNTTRTMGLPKKIVFLGIIMIIAIPAIVTTKRKK